MSVFRRFARVPFLALFTLAAAFAACDPSSPAEPEPSLGRVTMRVDGLSAFSIRRIVVEVEAANVTRELAFDPATASFTGTVVLPALTEHHARVRALDGDGEEVAKAEVLISVGTGATAAVNVTLFDASKRESIGAMGPIVRAVSISSTTLLPGEAAVVRVDAVNLEGGALSYRWRDDCSGQFADATLASTTWSKASVGACTISVEVESNQKVQSASVEAGVRAPGDGTVVLSGTYVQAPVVYGVWLTLPGNDYSHDFYRHSGGGRTLGGLVGGAPVRVWFRVDSIMSPADSDGGDPTTATRAWLTDSCGGTSKLGRRDVNTYSDSSSNLYAYFAWTPPVATDGGVACLLTAHAANEGLEDEFPIGVLIR